MVMEEQAGSPLAEEPTQEEAPEWLTEAVQVIEEEAKAAERIDSKVEYEMARRAYMKEQHLRQREKALGDLNDRLTWRAWQLAPPGRKKQLGQPTRCPIQRIASKVIQSAHRGWKPRRLLANHIRHEADLKAADARLSNAVLRRRNSKQLEATLRVQSAARRLAACTFRRESLRPSQAFMYAARSLLEAPPALRAASVRDTLRTDPQLFMQLVQLVEEVRPQTLLPKEKTVVAAECQVRPADIEEVRSQVSEQPSPICTHPCGARPGLMMPPPRATCC